VCQVTAVCMAQGHLRNGVLWENAVVINYGGDDGWQKWTFKSVPID